MESAESHVRKVAEEIGRQIPVEPGSDPRRPEVKNAENSELMDASKKYSEALQDAREGTAANDT